MYVDENHHMITYYRLKIIFKNTSLLYVVYIVSVVRYCRIHVTTNFFSLLYIQHGVYYVYNVPPRQISNSYGSLVIPTTLT